MSAEQKNETDPVTAKQPLKLVGFSQIRYTHWDRGNDGFSIKRARLGLEGEVFKNTRFKIQVDAVTSPVLLEAQVDFFLSPSAAFRVGQYKVPFSLENLTSSAALDTINRTQTVEKLCPGRDNGAKGRDIGIEVLGKVSKLEYAFGIFNGSGINTSDTNDHKDIAARLVFRPVDFLSFGGSVYKGKHSTKPDDPLRTRDRIGGELFFQKSRLSLKAEYISAEDGQVSSEGWYVQAGYSLISGKFQSIVRYDSYDKNKGRPDDRSMVVTMGLNWHFTEKTKLQLNYEMHKEEEPGKASTSAILAQIQAGF